MTDKGAQEAVRKPYWIWSLEELGTGRGLAIRIGEFFFLVLDRMADANFDIRPVTKALQKAAHALKDREMAEAADILENGAGDEEYRRLKNGSGRLFRKLMAPGAGTGPDRAVPEDRTRIIGPLIKELDGLAGRFREHLVRQHVRYFTKEGGLSPVHLGNMLYCLHGLECAIRELKGTDEGSGEPFRVRADALVSLFDWAGDLEQIMHEYWYEEFKRIAGLE